MNKLEGGILWFLFGLVALYCAGFGLSFSMDYLGRVPVLDARENLALANGIADGVWPEGPIYRAMVFPWLLSWIHGAVWVWPFWGVCLHFLNAILCGCIAAKLWMRQKAGWLSGLAYCLYPTALYFSVQLLDITLGISFFLSAVTLIFYARGRSWILVLAALIAGLSVCIRPNFLPAILVLPLVASLIVKGGRYQRLRFGCLAFLSLGLVLLVQGVLNFRHFGNFRILPWQGTYNLYAANTGEANGRYYKQSVHFGSVPAGMNTTRMESEYLYQAQTGSAEFEVDLMGNYWRGQLVDSILAEPRQWLQLMGRKVFYLLNDWEQYNNLSYEYQKQRFWQLRWNPVGWGVLFLGALAAAVLSMKRADRGLLISVFLIAGFYAGGVLLFFVSARFRLPLGALLCVLFGGLAIVRWRHLGLRQSLLLLLCLFGGGVLTYSNWFDAHDRDTFVQDTVLLANAALHLGDDLSALSFLEEGSRYDSDHLLVTKMSVLVRYNLFVDAEADFNRRWAELLVALQQHDGADALVRFIRGLALWYDEDQSGAVGIWNQAVEAYGDAAALSLLALSYSSQSVGESPSLEYLEMVKLLEREF